VDPNARRAGGGRALMRRLEQTARGIGRRLLVLDTLKGDAAEALYRGMGCHEVGAVPGFALLPDGSHGDTVFFWKSL
jgi:GNAT superfamily N-acetyltransferase